ncbi:unnamed protein product [Lupinus luteus]|uniref:Autophagy-related protein n=1 Tax=Lupinus luteus TaxID=3873 RepID=A0AAV1XIS9_LUPLU
MGGSFNFKDKYTFDHRLEESRYIVAKYPDRFPVIVERYAKCDLPELERKKYLVPGDLSVGQFIHNFEFQTYSATWKSSFCICEEHVASYC